LEWGRLLDAVSLHPGCTEGSHYFISLSRE